MFNKINKLICIQKKLIWILPFRGLKGVSFSKSQSVWRFAFCKCGLIECNQIITKGNIVVKIHINVATIDQFIFIIINYRHSKIKNKIKMKKMQARPGILSASLGKRLR